MCNSIQQNKRLVKKKLSPAISRAHFETEMVNPI